MNIGFILSLIAFIIAFSAIYLSEKKASKMS